MERKIPSIQCNLKSPTLINRSSGIQTDVFMHRHHQSRISLQKQQSRDNKLSNSLHLVNGKSAFLPQRIIDKQRKDCGSLNIAYSFNLESSSPIQKNNCDEAQGKGFQGKSTFSSIQSLCDFSGKVLDNENQNQIEKEDTSVTIVRNSLPKQNSKEVTKQQQSALPYDLKLEVETVNERFQNRKSKNLIDHPQLQVRSNSSCLDQNIGFKLQRNESKKSSFAPQNPKIQLEKCRRSSYGEINQQYSNIRQAGEDELGNQITDQSTQSAQQASYKKSEEMMIYQLEKSKYLVEKYSELLEKQDQEYKQRIQDQKIEIEQLKSLQKNVIQDVKIQQNEKTNALIQALANSSLEIDQLKHQRVPLAEFEQIKLELDMKKDDYCKIQLLNENLQQKNLEQESVIKKLKQRIKFLEDKQLPQIPDKQTSFLVHKLYLEKQEYEHILEQLIKERDELKALHQLKGRKGQHDNMSQDLLIQQNQDQPLFCNI